MDNYDGGRDDDVNDDNDNDNIGDDEDSGDGNHNKDDDLCKIDFTFLCPLFKKKKDFPHLTAYKQFTITMAELLLEIHSNF